MEFTSKVGNEAEPMILALTSDGGLLDFADLSDVVLRVRLKNEPSGTVTEYAVAEYTDDPENFNAEVTHNGWQGLSPGKYIAHVRATVNGETVFFPPDEFISIHLLRGL